MIAFEAAASLESCPHRGGPLREAWREGWQRRAQAPTQGGGGAGSEGGSVTSPGRPLDVFEREAIRRLLQLAQRWPKTIMVYAGSTGLHVIDSRTHRILATFSIPCDGGAGDVKTRDGAEFIDFGESNP